MENYLFTLPENERNTVKAFLLMQQERIENLEKTVHQLQRSIYSEISLVLTILTQIGNIYQILYLKKLNKLLEFSY
jgi:hypothetical protein